MQVLSKTTTDDAVDNLNFQEERNELLCEIDHWKRVADDRAQILDDMERELNFVRRELDDLYDRTQ